MQNTRIRPDDAYYSALRLPLLSLVERTPTRVLEIGCGHGQSLVFLKRQVSAKFVAGVELAPEVAEIARRNPEIDLVLTGDVEQMQFDFPAGHFDLIIASHVLEHLENPWSTARKLGTLLRPEGQFIGSLPNVRHAKVSLPLVLFGKFEYANDGILDWTHTKFFTKQTIQDFLRASGFMVEIIKPDFYGRATAINRLTLGLFKHFLCFAYNFSAKPAV